MMLSQINNLVCVYPQQITRRRKGSTDTTIQCFTDVISAIPTPSVGSRNYRWEVTLTDNNFTIRFRPLQVPEEGLDGGKHVHIFYLEEEVRSFSTPQTFQDSRGREYTTYRSIIFDRGYDTGAFPDTSVTGWVVYELPDGFEPEEMTLKVRQGSGEDLVWRFR